MIARPIAVSLPLALLVISACGGAATAPTATVAPATVTPATTAPSPAAATGAASWTVTSQSKATVRVREQLVGVNAPSDAVLTATGATGTFAPKSDGTFAPDSRITFDLATLASDSRDRDNFVKNDTLGTRQFPTATLVPTKANGLTMPLPSSGSFTFTLMGDLTIHGVTKAVAFDVQAKREGGSLAATATANPSFKFGDFGMRAPAVAFRVVSVVDEIRLVVDLVATGPSA